jgi:hypothetical protein
MGPRFDRAENVADLLAQAKARLNELQWGRAFDRAENVSLTLLHCSNPLLQWGRASIARKTARSGPFG